jgi:hypothetical protein
MSRVWGSLAVRIDSELGNRADQASYRLFKQVWGGGFSSRIRCCGGIMAGQCFRGYWVTHISYRFSGVA